MASVPEVSSYSAREATSVSVDAQFVEGAKGLGVSVPREAGLSELVAQERARGWSEQNRDAIGRHNSWVERHGMILSGLRALKL